MNDLITNYSPILPIDQNFGLNLDRSVAREIGEMWCEQYCFAEPYPHIILDNFLPESLAKKLLSDFPKSDLVNDIHYIGNEFQHNKRQISPSDCNEEIRNFFSFLNSASMLQFLEGLSSIDGLIPDPYFTGGGFHEISQGGKLGIHADFRINKQLYLERRLNLLIYLNENWKSEYGGCLELWDQSMTQKVKSIEPIFNRCVIFNTDANSYHGHPDPLNVPVGVFRRSLAMYYYTASRSIIGEVPSQGTSFQARPKDTEAVRRLSQKLKIKRILKLSEFVPPIIYRNLRELNQAYKKKRKLKKSKEA